MGKTAAIPKPAAKKPAEIESELVVMPSSTVKISALASSIPVVERYPKACGVETVRVTRRRSYQRRS